MVKHKFSLGPDSEQVCYVLCYDLNCVFQKKKKKIHWHPKTTIPQNELRWNHTGTGWALNVIWPVSFTENSPVKTDTQGGGQVKMGAETAVIATTSQGRLWIASSHKRSRGQVLPQNPQKEPVLPKSWSWTSSLWKCERKKNLVF